MNEPKVIRSIFNKVDLMTKKAGFTRDFTDNEIELIRYVTTTINLPPEENKDKSAIV